MRTTIKSGVLEPLSQTQEAELLGLIVDTEIPMGRVSELIERQLLRRLTEEAGSQAGAAVLAKMNRGTVSKRLNMA